MPSDSQRNHSEPPYRREPCLYKNCGHYRRRDMSAFTLATPQHLLRILSEKNGVPTERLTHRNVSRRSPWKSLSPASPYFTGRGTRWRTGRYDRRVNRASVSGSFEHVGTYVVRRRGHVSDTGCNARAPIIASSTPPSISPLDLTRKVAGGGESNPGTVASVVASSMPL